MGGATGRDGSRTAELALAGEVEAEDGGNEIDCEIDESVYFPSAKPQAITHLIIRLGPKLADAQMDICSCAFALIAFRLVVKFTGPALAWSRSSLISWVLQE